MDTEEIFTDFQEKVIHLVPNSHVPGKHCARNAIEGIRKAWCIKKSDPNMSCFRLITAEEESATAIFHALKNSNYTGAKKLQMKSHIHKNAVFPFLMAIHKTFSEYIKQLRPRIQIDDNKKTIEFGITMKGLDGDDYFVRNVPSLNFDIKLNGAPFDFVPEFKTMVNEKNNSVRDYLIEQANLRNKILYAASGGIPTVSLNDKFMEKRRDRIITLIIVFLLIDSYPAKQSFVQCALDSFMNIVEVASRKIKPEAFY